MFLYPKPQSLEISKGAFLKIGPGDVSVSEAGLPVGNKVRLDLMRPLKPEAYEIEISPAGILVGCSGEAGARLAFQTLRQILMQAGPEGVQCLRVSDSPELPVRGFMLDVSRCKIPTMQSLAYLVDMLALFKFNRLELYTEHSYAFRGHEIVWGDATPMTGQQYRMLDALCRRAGIDLVPNMNSLGHMDRWLRHPEYAALAECKAPFTDPMGNVRPYPTTLCPDDKAASFVASLYDDFLPNFTSKNFNVGCDEPWELGMGKSKQACDERGRGRVYIEYLKKLAVLCSKRGRRMHFWADVILEEPELSKELPDDVVAVLWGYYPDSPIDEEAKILHDLDRPFLVAGGTNSWNSFALRLDAAFSNVRAVCSAAKKWGAEGAVITNWGDNGNHQAWCAMWLPVIAFAQSAWGAEFSEEDVCRAADMFVFQDSEGRMSKAVCELGRADPAVKLHSLHNRLFFGKAADVRALVDDGAGEHFDRMFEGANKAIEHLAAAKPRCPDADVCKGELGLAADLIKWTVARSHDDPEIRSLNLRKTLKLMRSQYEQIWLARARVGGLFESSARAFIDRSEA